MGCERNILNGKGGFGMSEKRFSIFDDDEVEDVWNELKGTIYCYDEEEAQRCENWLNNLHNQNQKLKKENEQLKKRLYDFEKRKIIEESEIDEDVIPKVKLLRAELFGENV